MALTNNTWIKKVKVKMLSGEIVEFEDGKDNVVFLKSDDLNSISIVFKNYNDESLNKIVELSNLPMEKEFYTIHELRENRSKP